MKVAIVGSRDYPDWKAVGDYVASLDPDEDWIISGGARGVDEIARRHAEADGFPMLIFYPNLKKYGKSGYHHRNQKIVEAADLVVAFWDGSSPGTRSTIEKAKAAGKPVKLFPVDAWMRL